MNIACHRRNILYRLTPCHRQFSSQNEKARNYLANWAGTKNKSQTATSSTLPPGLSSPATETKLNKTNSNTVSQRNINNPSLQVTGSSYLLPTLCLPRHANAISLSEDLSNFLEENTNNHAIKSMLKPKPSPGNVTWRIPIILDLRAFQHDGSPHYIPPPAGFLSSVVETLDEWGISIMGLTNVQKVENIRDEINTMELPVLGRVGNGRTLGKGSSGVTGDSVDVKELVQLVLKQCNNNDSLLQLRENESGGAKQPEFTGGIESDLEDMETQEIGEPSMTRQEILDLTFRELQRECKIFNLGATGPTGVLQERILNHHGLDNIEDRYFDNGYDEVDNEADGAVVELSQEMLPQMNIQPKVYHGSVRSGQQVSSDEPNQSLVILGNVNSGGEVMADGDIYIFGALRGRALAGLSDASSHGQDMASKIISSHFDAELVCIGEVFTTVDSAEDLGLKRGAGAMVCRDADGALKFIGYS
jgi:septum formation inhibitor MinC